LALLLLNSACMTSAALLLLAVRASFRSVIQ
jgi:hypothetical protein